MADDLGATGGLFDAGSSSSGGLFGGNAGSILGGAGGIIGGIGSIFGGFMAADASKDEAKNFDIAAQFAQQNAALSGEVGNLQEITQARKILQTRGAQEAAAGANGLRLSGSSASLVRDTAQSGALTEEMVGLQSAINITNFDEQAQALHAQGQALRAQAQAQQTSGILGGLGGIIGGVAKIGSLFL